MLPFSKWESFFLIRNLIWGSQRVGIPWLLVSITKLVLRLPWNWVKCNVRMWFVFLLDSGIQSRFDWNLIWFLTVFIESSRKLIFLEHDRWGIFCGRETLGTTQPKNSQTYLCRKDIRIQQTSSNHEIKLIQKKPSVLDILSVFVARVITGEKIKMKSKTRSFIWYSQIAPIFYTPEKKINSSLAEFQSFFV